MNVPWPYIRPWTLFWWYLLLYGLFVSYLIYRKYYKGRIGPLTRKGEYEEYVEKQAVLDAHGKKPTGRIKKGFFGLFSWRMDDIVYLPDEDDEIDRVG